MRLIQTILLSLALLSTTYTAKKTNLPQSEKSTTTKNRKKTLLTVVILGVGVVVAGWGYAWMKKQQNTEGAGIKKRKTSIGTASYVLDCTKPACIQCDPSKKYKYDINLEDKEDDDGLTAALISIASFSYHTLDGVNDTCEAIIEALNSKNETAGHLALKKDGVEVALGQIGYHWSSMDKIKQTCVIWGYQVQENKEKHCTLIIKQVTQFMKDFPSIREKMHQNKDSNTSSEAKQTLITFLTDFKNSVSDLNFELDRAKEANKQRQQIAKERKELKTSFDQAYTFVKETEDAFQKVQKEYEVIEKDTSLQNAFEEDPSLQYDEGSNITFNNFGKSCIEPLKKAHKNLIESTYIIKELLKEGGEFFYEDTDLNTLKGFIAEVNQKRKRFNEHKKNIGNDQLILSIFHNNNIYKKAVSKELARMDDRLLSDLGERLNSKKHDYINIIDKSPLNKLEAMGWMHKKNLIEAKQCVEKATIIKDKLSKYNHWYETKDSQLDDIHYFKLNEEIKSFNDKLKRAKELCDNRHN